MYLRSIELVRTLLGSVVVLSFLLGSLVAFPDSALAQIKSSVPVGKSKGSPKTPSVKKASAKATAKNVVKYNEDGDIIGEPWQGEPGITETVQEIMDREAANPFVWDGIARRKRPGTKDKFKVTEKKDDPRSKEMDRLFLRNQVSQDVNDLLPQTAGTSIAGPDIASSGFIPPDTMGDVGPTQVLMHANGRIRVYNKSTGALGSLDVADSVFWNSVRNGAGVSDPHIEYDRLSGRWFLCIINVQAAPNRVLIAVSSGPVITNTSSFTFFQFTHDAPGVTPNTDTGGFADYPTWGIDANAAYMGMNIFNATGTAVVGTTVYVINKANLIAGTLTVTPFRQIGAAGGSGAGPWTPQAADNDDPTATTGYFVGVDNASFDLLNVRRVSTPGGVPTLSGNLNITVPTTRFPILQPHLGAATATRRLDGLDDRIFAARIHRNEITGATTLTAAHNIQVNTAGVGSTTGGRNGSRWYEIGNLTTTPALIQAGTLFDSSAANPNGFWIPSIAMSGQGHMAIGASSAGLARRAEIFASGRLRSDATGTLQAPTQLQSSSSNYNVEAVDGQRWGDYSQTSVDPCDNQTFWTFQQYTDVTNSWRMRAVQLRAAAPPTVLTPTPSSRGTGYSSFNVVVTGVSLLGTEFYDNSVGFTCNASCSGTGTGNCRMTASVTSSPLAPAAPLTINSVTFNSPTQVTLNLSTVGATNGTHTIRITNPDGQFTSFDFLVAGPTSSNASVGGRVLTPNGFGLNGAMVTLTDQAGNVRTTRSSSFGSFAFGDVPSGQTYVVAVNSKRFSFTPRTITVSGDIADLDLIGN